MAALLAAGLVVVAAAAGRFEDVTVRTELGNVVGETVELHQAGPGSALRRVHRFLGIPYGQSPEGEHRWRPPRPVTKFEKGVFQAKTCADPDQRAILVTINYRLGILGFLAHELLSAEQGGISGNYQLMDMVEALTWIQANISPFGGDPRKVTVFGQSFGGSAMQYLMLAPKARGLYASIISQSGGGISNYATQNRAEADTGRTFFSAIGCSTLECAREKSWEDCVDSGVGRSQPVVDPRGWLPMQPAEALRTGSINPVPAIFGHDIVENHLNDYFSGRDYEMYLRQYESDEYLRSVAINQLLGGCTTPECKQEYPSTESGADHALAALYSGPPFLPNNYERYSALRVDRANGMNTIKWAEQYARTAPAYRYVFVQGAEGSPTLGPFGCGHLVENLYVFGDPEIIGPGHTMTAGERRTVEETTKLWLTFARTGKPTDSWPRFDSHQDGATLLIGPDGTASIEHGWRKAQYRFHALWQGYCSDIFPCANSAGSASGNASIASVH